MNKKDEADLLHELKRKQQEISPDPEFVDELENKLIQRFSNRRRRNVFFPVVSLAVVGVLFFILAFNSNVLFEGTSSLSSISKPEVYIYHTHDTEAYLPHLRQKGVIDNPRPEDAFHEEMNITLIGEYLAESIESAGIGVLFEERKIQEEVLNQGLTYSDSYEISQQYIEETIDKYGDSIQMMFDIHRDTLERDQTTMSLNGEEVARIVFVVSDYHSTSDQNLAFAKKLHERVDEKYPGLSRGVLLKGNQTFNQNMYNQDLLGQSVLLEIGGYQNSMEEVKRATDYLSDIIVEILQE
ncbi:stage II sporulation protein P [Alkalihalobacillus sp. MEB130]|uniref:stage II sporulation protein P n=1 Tax=Alkalihalobacillus sp. MEB130 TaxID=2976704 RepID=UPI0028E04322|nr:stage II sporulation protein P [Alkalihalobacillus sp. MEB130]MDT8861038.1 stage II sporulation protein P [Alkalihalobacillus sp. MEB130]